jgi:putative membrane protein
MPMLVYDPHDWWRHFFDIRGSMLREITGRVSSCVIWAAMVVVLDKNVDIDWHISTAAHSLVGVALGLLLVLRTNASYERWWEGRKLWGSLINEERNLGRLASVHLAGDPALRDAVLTWGAAFSSATMVRLRDGRGIGCDVSRLPADEVAEVENADHVPLAIARKLTGRLVAARDRGLISDYILGTIDADVHHLVDYLGACERIHRTPLPFPYVVHVRRILMLYALALPMALVDDYGWMTIVATLVVSYVFFGIEEIGVVIEDPFGADDNDLPLESFCETIAANLHQLGEEAEPAAPR